MRYLRLHDAAICALAEIRAAHPAVSIPASADVSALGYARIESVPRPADDDTSLIERGAPEEYAPGHWRETWVIAPIPLATLKNQARAALAAVRYRHETAGLTLNGARIATDRESQALITGAWSYSQINPTALIDWKGADGTWVQIDATTIAGIAAAVAGHVQACFSRERALAELIAAAETAEELAEVDLESGWPA